MKSRTVQLDEHEAVVDRDWLGEVGHALLGHAAEDHEMKMAEECIRISEDYPGDEEDDLQD